MSEREDWVQSMLAAGLGITLMLQFLPLIDGFDMRPIVEPEVYRTVSLVTVAGRRHTPGARAAVDVAHRLNWQTVV